MSVIRSVLGRKLLPLMLGLLTAILLAEGLLRVFWSSLELPDDVVTDYPFRPKHFGERGFFPVPDSLFSSRYDGDPYDTLPDDLEVHYRLNEHGFRDDPFPPIGPAGNPQIAVLGDSFVFGEGVERGDRLTEVCAERLRQRGFGEARVLNLGVSGFASEDEADLAKAFLPGLTPLVVVVGYCLNDPVHLLDFAYRDRFAFDLVMRRDAAPKKGDGQESISYIMRLIQRRLKTARMTSETIHWYREMYQGPSAPWVTSRTYLLRIRDLARKRGAGTALLLMPIFHDLDDEYPFTEAHETIGAWCRSNDIAVLDALDVLRDRDSQALIVHPKDHHPNAEAHRLMGEALAEFLRIRYLEAR